MCSRCQLSAQAAVYNNKKIEECCLCLSHPSHRGTRQLAAPPVQSQTHKNAGCMQGRPEGMSYSFFQSESTICPISNKTIFWDWPQRAVRKIQQLIERVDGKVTWLPIQFTNQRTAPCLKLPLVSGLMTSPRSCDYQWTTQRTAPNLKLPRLKNIANLAIPQFGSWCFRKIWHVADPQC